MLVGDGIAWSIMTGAGEWQFVLFALALGLGEVVSGLVATIPVFAGAILQLVTPWGVRRTGSVRRWVWVCAAVQAVSIVPLVIGALTGGMPAWVLYVVIAVYWGSGYMTGPRGRPGSRHSSRVRSGRTSAISAGANSSMATGRETMTAACGSMPTSPIPSMPPAAKRSRAGS